MSDHAFNCPYCGVASPPIQQAFPSMPPVLRMQWETALGRAKREWLIAFTFAWILILSGILFLWIARHDPVNEGQMDAISKVLSGGSMLGGLLLFSLSLRDWREGNRQAPKRALLKDGRYCGSCNLVWDQTQQLRLPAES
jgi:hypothetical protein